MILRQNRNRRGKKSGHIIWGLIYLFTTAMLLWIKKNCTWYTFTDRQAYFKRLPGTFFLKVDSIFK